MISILFRIEPVEGQDDAFHVSVTKSGPGIKTHTDYMITEHPIERWVYTREQAEASVDLQILCYNLMPDTEARLEGSS